MYRDGETAQYRYNLAGNAVWIKNGYGEVINEFDAGGNLVSVKDAQTGAVKFRYERDAQGADRGDHGGGGAV